MILGSFHDHLPRVTLTLPGRSGSIAVEFILDTGFEGDLSLPSNILRQLAAQPLFLSVRAMGDGSLRECPVYHLAWQWNENHEPWRSSLSNTIRCSAPYYWKVVTWI
jgi:predicted aspartyl protease